MILDKTVLYPKFISEEERVALKEHALFLLNSGELKENKAGPNRYYKSFFDEAMLSAIHQKLYRKVLNTIKLNDPMIDPFLGIIISVIKPNGFIHEHRDRYSGQLSHLSHKHNVRFNVMIERGDDNSYDPKIKGASLKVNRRDAWWFDASVSSHSTDVIIGPEFRIVYQFGFCVDAN